MRGYLDLAVAAIVSVFALHAAWASAWIIWPLDPLLAIATAGAHVCAGVCCYVAVRE